MLKSWASAAVALAVVMTPLHAQSGRSEFPLVFLGIRAGEPVDSIAQLIRADGGNLRCGASHSDPRVEDCRATYLVEGAPIDVWLSSIGGVAAIITLSTPLDQSLLQSWRRDLEVRYGQAYIKAQGPQWMLQWVRQNRMLRLVWRIDGAEKKISVSLIDGKALDGWSAPRVVHKRASTVDSTGTRPRIIR